MKKTNGKLNKTVKIVAKIFEIVHWAGIGLMVAVAICSIAAGDWLMSVLDTGAASNQTLSFYGYEVTFANSAGEVSPTAILMFAIGTALICPLMAMIFRNIYLIVKKSEGTTPFNNDNVRMLKEIGIFAIVIPIVGLIMGIITSLVIGLDTVNYVHVNADGFIMGLIVLALTHIFAYGVELEKDVDGLL